MPNLGIFWVIGPLALSAVLYALTAAGYFFMQGRPGMGLAFVGYVIGNIGFVWDAVMFAPTK